MINLEKQRLNELASNWYCLSELLKNTLTPSEAAEASARYHELSQQLIPLLTEKKATKDNPLETCIEGDTFVNLWLDENGGINDSGYYARPALYPDMPDMNLK